MTNYFSKIRETGKGLVRKLREIGVFSVFLSNVLCKVLTFIGGMVIVRVLNKNDYGAYTYIMNCYGMLILLNDLGCNVATMQSCSEHHKNPEKFNSYFTYGYRMGMLFSGITALLIFCSPWFYPFQQEVAAQLTRTLCLMPFLSTTSAFLLANLRIRLENHKYALINFLNTGIHYLVILPLSLYFGIQGAVWSNYIITFLVVMVSLLLSRGNLQYSWTSCHLTGSEKRNFLKLAVASQINNGVDHGLVLLDVFLIGLFIGNNEIISSYKVSTTIPSALAFIPSSVMVCLIPYFSRRCGDIPWVRTQYKKVLLLGAAGNSVITLGGIVLAPWILPLLFGSQYHDAVPCFQILMVGYFFSATFRMPTANILYTQRRVRDNISITFSSGICNCILDVVLIMVLGSIGAAIATTLVHIFNSALSLFFMHKYLRGQENTI